MRSQRAEDLVEVCEITDLDPFVCDVAWLAGT